MTAGTSCFVTSQVMPLSVWQARNTRSLAKTCQKSDVIYRLTWLAFLRDITEEQGPSSVTLQRSRHLPPWHYRGVGKRGRQRRWRGRGEMQTDGRGLESGWWTVGDPDRAWGWGEVKDTFAPPRAQWRRLWELSAGCLRKTNDTHSLLHTLPAACLPACLPARPNPLFPCIKHTLLPMSASETAWSVWHISLTASRALKITQCFAFRRESTSFFFCVCLFSV